MTVLLAAIIFGLGFTFFAIQNTTGVTIQIANYVIPNVPLYLVATGALLAGLAIAWIFNIADNLAAFFSIRGRENKIHQKDSELQSLKQQIHNLEVENARLKAIDQTEEKIVPAKETIIVNDKPNTTTAKHNNLIEKIKHQFSY